MPEQNTPEQDTPELDAPQTVGRLARIFIHPVKSARRTEVSEVAVTPHGLAGDRLYQVVDAQDDPITQRTNRLMALLSARYIGDETNAALGAPLELSAPDTAPVVVEPPAQTDRTVRSLLGEDVEAADCGDDAASLLGELLGQPARLAAFTANSVRTSRLFRGREVAFVDAAPVLVANQASVEDLERRATERFGIERFRPNLVVEGAPPWAEDTWVDFTVGEAQLAVRVPWPRCAVPQIDQDTAKRNAEPAVVLRHHRWCDDASDAYPHRPGMRAMLEGNSLFGVACTIDPPGAMLRVGDEVTVSSTGLPVLAPPAR